MSNSTKPTDTGMNRTGVAMSPIDAKRMVEGANEGSPKPSFDVSGLAAVRTSFSKVVEPVGTVPPPASIKGVAKTGMQMLKGNDANVLLDLVADRLAFERTGVRLYEALLAKHDAAGAHPGGPTRETLEQIRDDELAHFGLLVQAMERLGGDPTAVTPMADVCAVASLGLVQVLSDPRTTLTQGLHAIHIAELTDNDGWLLLADLASRMGHEELGEQFRGALAQEEVHLAHVRAWLAAAIDHQAGIAAAAVAPGPGAAPTAP